MSKATHHSAELRNLVQVVDLIVRPAQIERFACEYDDSLRKESIMNTIFHKAAALVATLIFLGAAGAQATETANAAEPAGGGAPGVAAKVGNAIERGAKAAASGVERGAKAAARGVERGAKAAASGVKRGAKAAANGVERGAEATANAAHTVAGKVGGSSAPAASPDK